MDGRVVPEGGGLLVEVARGRLRCSTGTQPFGD